MLESGSPAPEMVLEDTMGNTVRLSDYRGEHAVLLYFVRATSCPVCNRNVQDLIRSGDDLTADNVRVLIAVPESRERAAAWKARQRVPFPVLTARRGTPHEMVGLGRRLFGTMQQSGSLLVDVHGIVRYVHSATLPTGGYDRKGVMLAVRRR
ncbi:peroxiredoxin family protein [Streptosporangium algeriense]|uniref:thioredoxin-dependent peroxiredoxin n=1 Tax=Streptosporangium algeriense TaxID=1682748 RepID=A0ABW3DMR6_9ACTN